MVSGPPFVLTAYWMTMPSRRTHVALCVADGSALRVCGAVVGEVHAALGRGAPTLRGWLMWCGRFVIGGIKVSFWASGTLKIVIPIENYPTNGVFGWLVITPYEGWRCELADSIYIFTIYIGGKQRT